MFKCYIKYLLLSKLDNTSLMFIISIILIDYFLLVMFKTKGSYLAGFLCVHCQYLQESVAALLVVPDLSSVYYTHFLGSTHVEAVQKRIIPSLIIQILSLLLF